MRGIDRRELILLRRIAAVDDLYGIHTAGEKTDMINIIRLPVRVRLHDESTGRAQKVQPLAVRHLHDLRMVKIPRPIKPVNEKIRTGIRHFHAAENLEPDLTTDALPLLCVEKIELDFFPVRAALLDPYIAVQKMIGDEHAVIAGAAVKVQRLRDRHPGTRADG